MGAVRPALRNTNLTSKADLCSFSCSRLVHGGLCRANAAMGPEEAQDLPQGAREKLSQEEHHDPLYLVDAEVTTGCDVPCHEMLYVCIL